MTKFDDCAERRRARPERAARWLALGLAAALAFGAEEAKARGVFQCPAASPPMTAVFPGASTFASSPRITCGPSSAPPGPSSSPPSRSNAGSSTTETATSSSATPGSPPPRITFPAFTPGVRAATAIWWSTCTASTRRASPSTSTPPTTADTPPGRWATENSTSAGNPTASTPSTPAARAGSRSISAICRCRRGAAATPTASGPSSRAPTSSRTGEPAAPRAR